jgi:hypothetical protein
MREYVGFKPTTPQKSRHAKPPVSDPVEAKHISACGHGEPPTSRGRARGRPRAGRTEKRRSFEPPWPTRRSLRRPIRIASASNGRCTAVPDEKRQTRQHPALLQRGVQWASTSLMPITMPVTPGVLLAEQRSTASAGAGLVEPTPQKALRCRSMLPR